MKIWVDEIINSNKKIAMPIIAYPGAALLGYTVEDIIASSQKQLEVIKEIKQRTNMKGIFGFMDLTIEAECFGAEIQFSENEIPVVVGQIIDDVSNIKNLTCPELSDRAKIAIETAKAASFDDALYFANAIGPFSLAGRLFGITEALIACYENPNELLLLLQICTDFIIKYISQFKQTNAAGVIMAEPLAGILSPELAKEFSAVFVKQIIGSLQDDNFSFFYHNCGNNTVYQTESICSVGARGYHFGNAIKIQDIIGKMPSDCLVMGNIDPVGVLKSGSTDLIKSTVGTLLEECKDYSNFVISTGCDTPYETPWVNVEAFFEAVNNYK